MVRLNDFPLKEWTRGLSSQDGLRRMRDTKGKICNGLLRYSAGNTRDTKLYGRKGHLQKEERISGGKIDGKG